MTLIPVNFSNILLIAFALVFSNFLQGCGLLGFASLSPNHEFFGLTWQSTELDWRDCYIRTAFHYEVSGRISIRIFPLNHNMVFSQF